MLLCPRCHMAVQVPPHLLGQAVGCPACGSPLVAPPPAFDPYYTWLGIPPAEQPPHHYRLLGLQLFEVNPQVIENAADRQMKHLQSFKIGARAADSQRLLNEVSAARVCLLDPASKAVYDQQLRLASSGLTPATPYIPPTSPFDSLSAVRATQPTIGKQRAPRSTKKKDPPSLLSTIVIVLGAVTGLAIGVLGIFYVTGQDILGLSGKLRQQTAQSTPPGPHSKPAPPSEKTRTAEIPSTSAARDWAKTATPAPPPSVSPAPPGNSAAAPPPPTKPAPTAQPQAASAPVPSPRATVTHPPQQTPQTEAIQSIRLPPVDSDASAPLFRLTEAPMEPLLVTIATDAADLPTMSSLALVTDPQGRGWMVNYAADEAASAMRTTLAVIRRDGRELKFSWVLPLVEKEVRQQLANCLLEIRLGPETKHLLLREPLVISPPTLDLNKEIQTFEIPAVDLPPTSKLMSRFTELSSLPKGGKLKGGGDIAPVGKPTAIKFADMPGVALELRFLRPVAGKFALRVEPVFHEIEHPLFRTAGNQLELTFVRLEKYRATLENLLAKNRATLPVVQGEVAALSSNLAILSKNRPTTAQQKAQLDFAKSQADAAIEAGAQRVTALQTQITEMQLRLTALPEIKDFLDSLHRKATIKYVVYTTVAGKEVVLVDASGEQ